MTEAEWLAGEEPEYMMLRFVCTPIAARSRRWSQEIVDDDLKRPRLEQIQADADQRQKQADYRLSPKRLVIAKDAPVDGHANFGLRFRLD